MKLRPYQEQIIAEVKQAMMKGHRAVLMQMATGAGKTKTACEMVRTAHAKGKRVYWVCHRQELVSQASETFMAAAIPHGLITAGQSMEADKMVHVCSVQTLTRRLDKVPKPDLVIYDECFSGDTEILTEKGWQRFDELERGVKVAQVDMHSRETDFVMPDEYIETAPKSKVVHIKKKEGVDLILTEGHEMLCETGYRPQHRKVEKVAVKDLRVDKEWARMWFGGFGTGEESTLSPEEKLSVAYQADGTVHYTRKDGSRVIRFEFSKERKTIELKAILDEMGVDYKEYTTYREKINSTTTAIRFEDGFNLSKNLWDIFDIASLSAEKASEVFHYGMLWDGSKNRDGTENYQYSSKVDGNADFYQAVCCLFQKKSKITKRKRRSKKHSTLSTLSSSSRDTVGCKGMDVSEVPDIAKVYCVRVPKGNIIVRRNGMPLVVGNCHHLHAKSWAATYHAFKGAHFIGLTATPYRLTGEGLGDFFSHMVKGPSVRWLIEQGFLSDYRIFSKPMDLQGVKVTAGDFNRASLAEKMKNSSIMGNLMEEYRRHANGKKMLVFAPTIEFGEKLTLQLASEGIPAAMLDGTTEKSLRAMTLKRFKDGDIDVIVNVDLFGEGFDAPGIECVAMLRPTQSLSLCLQQYGRGLRAFPGKEHAIILDLAGNALRHGLPDDDRDWTLEGEKEEPKGEKLPSLATCDTCFGAFPPASKVCPYCGSEKVKKQRVIRTEKGRLQEIKRQEKQKKEQEKAAKRRARAGVTNYQEAVEFAEKQNYDPAWAVHFAKAKGWEITE